MQRWEANAPRFAGNGAGHYESYFVRANHPHARVAFWLRYTVLEPAGHPSDAVGELWAVVFDGRRIVNVKTTLPIADVSMDGSPSGLDLRMGRKSRHGKATSHGHAAWRDGATSAEGALRGAASSDGHTITWDLRYAGGNPPLTLLPERWYGRRFPKAKAVTSAPLAQFAGQLVVDGAPVRVDEWTGSANHNWGSRHTDEYAWGQVCGFDGAPASFLELSTARVHFGSRMHTPWLSPIVVRHDDRELRLNGLLTSARAHARYDLGGLGVDVCRWTFRSRGRDNGVPVTVSGEIVAPHSAFVTLAYGDPSGGQKTCHNTKVATCRLRIERSGEPPVELHTTNRAAFEVLTLHAAPPLDAAAQAEPLDTAVQAEPLDTAVQAEPLGAAAQAGLPGTADLSSRPVEAFDRVRHAGGDRERLDQPADL